MVNQSTNKIYTLYKKRHHHIQRTTFPITNDPPPRSLTAVVEQIQTNARDLGDLHMKVEGWNRQGLDGREISLRSKDEQLRSECVYCVCVCYG